MKRLLLASFLTFVLGHFVSSPRAEPSFQPFLVDQLGSAVSVATAGASHVKVMEQRCYDDNKHCSVLITTAIFFSAFADEGGGDVKRLEVSGSFADKASRKRYLDALRMTVSFLDIDIKPSEIDKILAFAAKWATVAGNRETIESRHFSLAVRPTGATGAKAIISLKP
jgi:hypothetical protein